MLYLDTSLIVAALSNEPATADAQRWMADQAASELAISDWTITEFSCAMAIKLRTGHIALEHRAAALSMFARLVAETFEVVPVNAAHFRKAATFADQHALGLRSGDALHLAIASAQGATIHTLDKQLHAAGPLLGVPVRMLD